MIHNNRTLWSIVTAAVFVAVASPTEAAVVKGFEITGNKRIESSTIQANTNIVLGQDIERKELDDATISLFNTGYFSDVDVDIKGNKVTIKVSENPIVGKVAFEGNFQFDDAALSKQTRLKPRQIFTETRLKQDTKMLHDIYRFKGHFAAQITPKIIRREQNRVDIVYEVKEGGATKIAQIIFVGNKKFKSSDLKNVISTKESRWWRFFSSDDNYDPDRLALDQELLRREYLRNGYIDFIVKSAVAELTDDQNEFFITFTVDEGERYTYGDITIDNHVEDVPKSELEALVTFVKGNWYSSRDMDKTMKSLTDYLGHHGYAFVDIRPDIKKNDETRTVDIKLSVMQGPKVYVNRIVISGNIRTNEDVIRRQLLFYEGDAYNNYKIKRSEQELKNLGYFKKVTIKERPSDTPDQIDLYIELDEEEATGELWLAGGYSTAEGPLSNIGVKENNLMGRGYKAQLQATVSGKRQQVDFSFTEPNFLNRGILAGVDLFNVNTKGFDNNDFRHQKTGFSLRTAYLVSDQLTQSWTYTLSFDKVSDVPAAASRFIKQQSGDSTTSSLTHRIILDKRDSRIDPTEGFYVGMSNEFAGLGGNIKYFKNEVFGGYYCEPYENWVVGLTAKAGHMVGFGGRTVRIVDRFSMGGDGNLRGFEQSGAEARDRETLDPLGGLQYYLASAELQVPLGYVGVPDEFGVKGHVFSDIGAAWGADAEDKTKVFDTAAPRAAVGFGISWKSPMGPLRIDFAQDVLTQSFDKHKRIHFGFFSRF